MNKFIILLLLSFICRSFSQNTEVTQGLSESLSHIMNPKPNEVHPDYPWLHYKNCDGFPEPNPFYELLAARYSGIPTSGVQEMFSADIYAKKTHKISQLFGTVKWNGLPFASGTYNQNILHEEGKTYTINQKETFQLTPAGTYQVFIKLYNEFGEAFDCLQADFYVRPRQN